jgi:hypothetical protein
VVRRRRRGCSCRDGFTVPNEVGIVGDDGRASMRNGTTTRQYIIGGDDIDNIQSISATSDDAFAAVKSTVCTRRRRAGDITPDLSLATFKTRLCRALPRDRLLGEANRLLSVVHPGTRRRRWYPRLKRRNRSRENEPQIYPKLHCLAEWWWMRPPARG